MDQIEEIKRKINIVELVSEHVELKRAGRNFKGLCPFHSEKTPSFMVSPELQIFKCFGCGAGGDAYRFLMEQEKIDFPQALKILADGAGVQLKPVKGYTGFKEKEDIHKVNFMASEFYHFLLVRHNIGEKALSYLKSRGVTDDSIKVFKLGFAPDTGDTAFQFLTKKRNYDSTLLEKAGVAIRKDTRFFDRFRGRIIFPLRDHYGNVLGFSGRVLIEAGDVAKYINTPETIVYKKGRMFYGLDVAKQAIKKLGFAIIVEGEFDVIGSWQAGVQNVIAIKGSALTEEQAELISRFCSSVVLALDSDLAGDKASWRGIEVAQKQGLEIKAVHLGDFKDPDEFARRDSRAWKRAVEQAEGVYDFLIDSSFGKVDVATTEGKAKISRVLAPILAGIGDEIVKADCIRKVAERLGVGEDAVRLQVERQPHSVKEDYAVEQQTLSPKTRRDILEEYLLKIAFQTDPGILENNTELIRDPSYLRLLEEYRVFKNLNTDFDRAEFSKRLPSELVDVFASLVLGDLETSFVQTNDAIDEARQVEKTIRILDMEDDRKSLSHEIREQEGKGESKKMNVLISRLTKINTKLSELKSS